MLFAPLTTSRVKTSGAASGGYPLLRGGSCPADCWGTEQKIQEYSYDYNTGAPLQNSTYDKSAVTPVGGLVVRPLKNLSLYANYIEALTQGGTAPEATSTGGAVANGGEHLAPYKSKQYEVGAKYDQGNIGATLALFQITEPSA